MRTVIFAAVALAMSGLSRSAQAGPILFTNLPTSGALYNCCQGVAVTGSETNQGSPGSSAEGFEFTSSATAYLAEIDVALFSVANYDSSLLLTLNADTVLFGTQDAPGAVLESWTLSDLPVNGTCCILQTVIPSAPVLLTSGTQYWLVGTPISDLTFVGFNRAVIPGDMLRVLNKSNQSFQFLTESPGAAFEVLGTPEPSSVALVAVPLAILVYRRRSWANILGLRGKRILPPSD